MKTASAVMIILFYVFFFVRSGVLTRKLGKKIKAGNLLLNASILCAGLSSVLFILQVFHSSIVPLLLVVSDISVLQIPGVLCIGAGLILSSAASLNLGKSWRIGILKDEKTGLVTSGIYRISRNPYFLSYDIVLIGIVLSSQSLVVALLSLATIVLFHLMILNEEKFLEAQHGDKYLSYKKRVRRYL